MKTHQVGLVTIIIEALAKEAIVELLKQIKVQGWTCFTVTGSGSQGLRPGDIEEFSNVQFEVLLAPEQSENLLLRLRDEFFSRYAIVVHVQEVRVLRSEKFIQPGS
jgi:nitrogen regulatory protein PII